MGPYRMALTPGQGPRPDTRCSGSHKLSSSRPVGVTPPRPGSLQRPQPLTGPGPPPCPRVPSQALRTFPHPQSLPWTPPSLQTSCRWAPFHFPGIPTPLRALWLSRSAQGPGLGVPRQDPRGLPRCPEPSHLHPTPPAPGWKSYFRRWLNLQPRAGARWRGRGRGTLPRHSGTWSPREAPGRCWEVESGTVQQPREWSSVPLCIRRADPAERILGRWPQGARATTALTQPRRWAGPCWGPWRNARGEAAHR